ncbi:mandelate racemase/muconate lactonizing enzyme family protein [Fictibacillus sp. KU28468]|uniref:mandelate racemase/muconate lactonizing enzyme family protein n=1 Tax=Fictibacillus sp. KU28468 TaxID=2991053 RepID=UPI00223E1AD9|nr:enolase C-terminal domain-like protein [Fictibacillus sp. KU28468]UZJ80938.1 mandelate racemase [Fictibacillus sp. KU28468]
MFISKIEVFPLTLPMLQDFRISGGSVGDMQAGAPHVYVKITDKDGISGWGEARPSHRWSYETIESVTTTINTYFIPALIGKRIDDISYVHQVMNQEIKSGLTVGQPIAKAAIDTALHDLIGQRNKKTIGELWMGSTNSTISLSYLISTRDVNEAVQKATEANRKGYKGLDVKIGFDPDHDIHLAEAVREAAPGLFFRVDANQGYTVAQAIYVARKLEKLGVDVFEQPLSANNLLGHAEIRRKVHIPIALDESIWSSGDLIQAIRMEACDTAVIKLTKMAGLYRAKICGEIAKEAGLALLGGGLTESTLGLAASAHLFNYLQISAPVDLNGPFFLADDPVSEGPVREEGTVYLGDRYGIGCKVSSEKLQNYAVE